MTNTSALRIAAVTEAIQMMLLPVVQAVVADAQVRVGPPTAEADGQLVQGLNVFLFHVARNNDEGPLALPTRSPTGQLQQRPTMAVSLHYLFSFFGDSSKLVPQQMLGRVLTALNAHPVLTVKELDTLVAYHPDGLIARSGLADQGETVSLNLMRMSLEELTRVWGMFQLPYTLTVPIVASRVLLEAAMQPNPAPPVTMVRMSVGPGPPAEVADMEDPAVEIGDVVLIPVGSLRARGAQIVLAGTRHLVDAITENDIRLRLRPKHLAGLSAGATTAQVLDKKGILVGETHIAIRPYIERIAATRKKGAGPSRIGGRPGAALVTMQIQPPVQADDTVEVSLLPIDDPGRTIGGKKRSEDPILPASIELGQTGGLQVSFESMWPGVYRVLLTVNDQVAKQAPQPERGLPRDVLRFR